MARLEVAPAEIREAGARVRAFGPNIQAVAADASRLAGAVSEPGDTATALGELARGFFQALSRLADDVEVLGGMAAMAADGYEVVDDRAIPKPGTTKGRP